MVQTHIGGVIGVAFSDELNGRSPPCASCGAAKALSVCALCRAVRYCSRACQRAAWIDHKKSCANREKPSNTAQTALCTSATLTHKRNESRNRPSTSRGEWLGLVNTDAFPGQDYAFFPPPADLAEVRRQCLQQGCGGFVTFTGGAYTRCYAAAELIASRARSVGSTLWLPIMGLATEMSAMRARGECTPPESIFALSECLPEIEVPGASGVPKKRNVSVEEMNSCFDRSEPLVLQDAQEGWTARRSWTFEWLSERFGQEEILCSDLAPFFKHCDRERIQSILLSMREYVCYVRGKPNVLRGLQRSDEQVFYANAWTPFSQHPDLLFDVSDKLYCVEDSIPRGGETSTFNNNLTKVFFGPAGTVSRLHHDSYATHVWLSQIRGRKQFICYPPDDSHSLHGEAEDEVGGRTSAFDPSAPDYEAFPRVKCARPYSVVVEEGETVILPSRWWHWAKSLTPSITLMRNFVNATNHQQFSEICQRVNVAKKR
eukprot:TRINITY_DN42648_c0_g1_i1.p1 TRINITY_DN42648_c0_g1~~TRINITY_DN42648_c0_g1_i1.p1  ORF type:complete len:487 (-),score=60.68 TRINITY_DN42648_c0_g1_i1:15-1475(-)